MKENYIFVSNKKLVDRVGNCFNDSLAHANLYDGNQRGKIELYTRDEFQNPLHIQKHTTFPRQLILAMFFPQFFYSYEMAEARPLQNEWNEPFHVFGPGEGKLRRRVLRQVDDYRIDRDRWKQETQQTDQFLNKLVDKMNDKAKIYSQEFKIEKGFVKQASARQGLKINAPDENDVIVPFKINGLKTQTAKVRDPDGRIIPGMTRQRVLNKNDINSTHPRLKQAGVFTEQNGNIFINTQNFHGKVWTKLVDKAVAD